MRHDEAMKLYARAQDFFCDHSTKLGEENDIGLIAALDLYVSSMVMQKVPNNLAPCDWPDNVYRSIFEELYWFRLCESMQFLTALFPHEEKIRHMAVQLCEAYHKVRSRACDAFHGLNDVIPMYDLRNWMDRCRFYCPRYMSNEYTDADRELLKRFYVTRRSGDDVPPVLRAVGWLLARILSHAETAAPLHEPPFVLELDLTASALALRKKNPLEFFDLAKCFIIEWPEEFYNRSET